MKARRVRKKEVITEKSRIQLNDSQLYYYIYSDVRFYLKNMLLNKMFGLETWLPSSKNNVGDLLT